MSVCSRQTAFGRLNPDKGEGVLVGVARKRAQKLEVLAAADRARSSPEPISGARADRANGAIYRLLAERGRAAEVEGSVAEHRRPRS